MERKTDGDGEKVHSLWSQETELNSDSFDLSANALSSDTDDSRRKAPSSTACSTPHERNLASVRKRKFESSFEELSPKKSKFGREPLLSPDIQQEPSFSNSNGTEDSNHSEVVVKKTEVVYAEANSSSSHPEVLSSQNIESGDRISTRASSPPLKIVEHQRHGKNDPSAKDKGIQDGRWIIDSFTCSIAYRIDESKNEIISSYIKEITRNSAEAKQVKLSISSGTLGDSSSSEVNSVHSGIEKFPLPQKLSLTSISSSSSSSSAPSIANKHRSSIEFLIPQSRDVKKNTNSRCKGCVCQCFCDKLIACLKSGSSTCNTSETLSSSTENLKSDIQERCDRIQETAAVSLKRNGMKEEGITDTANESSNVRNNSQSSVYIPASSNLPVFAKWPGNSWFYPGIIENAEEETWHTISHLEVKFCDGSVKKILNKNLFPAYLLPTNTKVIYEKNGNSEEHTVTTVNKLSNNELFFMSESGESIPFQKICFSDTCYKELLKENISVLTPRKAPRFSVSTDNVQEGKRFRRTVKLQDPASTSASKTKVTSVTKKTPSFSRGKRGRGINTTDSSSSEQMKTEKKRIRGSSQRKQKPKPGTGTSCGGDKKEVARKLDLETPGCSNVQQTNDTKLLEITEDITSNSSDLDSSSQVVDLMEVSNPYLDPELVPNVSRRALQSKSSSRKLAWAKKNHNVEALGPLPKTPIFSGYNFILTHSNKKKIKPLEKLHEDQLYSEEGSGTDLEDYYETSIPFEHFWLREQIIAGGGKVFVSLLDVPAETYSATIIITDGIYQTANYLLAVSLGIPIYRHDLIIDCCKQVIHVSKTLGDAMKMPSGRSLETLNWVENTYRYPLKGHFCLLSLNVNQVTLNFWKKLITNAGAKVVEKWTTELLAGYGTQISFLVGDLHTPASILLTAMDHEIPVVSTAWVIQTIIYGRPRPVTACPQYNINYIPENE